MRSHHPTLLIGLEAFGREVVERVAGETEAEAPALIVATLAADDTSGDSEPDAADASPVTFAEQLEAVLDEAEAHSQRLLELGHFIATTADEDTRGPCLDVFVIAALDEILGTALVTVIEQLGERLRSRFRPVLEAGQGRLCICPLLLFPRAIEQTYESDARDAMLALSALTRDPVRSRRPGGHIYLSEDQSGKYVLPRSELVASFAAFLRLLGDGGVRADSSMRALVEASDESELAPFGTFTCATLDVGIARVHEICALTLATELLANYDDEPPPLSAIASDASKMVPEVGTISAQLWQEGERDLESYLEPPAIEVPEIVWSSEPEDITERALGQMWQLGVKRAIAAFRDRVETLQMDRLSAQIERNGAALAAAVTTEWSRHTEAEVSTGPRGLVRALALTEYASDSLRSRCESIKRRLDAPGLGGFPQAPLAQRLEAVYEATDAWPRHTPARMRLAALISLLCGSVVIAGFAHWLGALFGYPIPWWVSALIGLVMSGPSIGYDLWRHRKRHYNWLDHARDELEQALQHHVQRELVAYFRGRLFYSRDLWIYRIYRRLQARLDTLANCLKSARVAVRKACDIIEGRRHAESALLATTRQSDSGQRGGILYHVLLDIAAVDAIYRYIRPPDLRAVGDRFHRELAADEHYEILEAPFADLQHVMAFCRRELLSLGNESAFDTNVPPLMEAAQAGARMHIARLVRKLSPPLELLQSAVAESAPLRRIVVAPPEASELIDSLLTPLDQRWQRHESRHDPQRIHLVMTRHGLSLEAVARLSNPSKPSIDSLTARGSRDSSSNIGEVPP